MKMTKILATMAASAISVSAFAAMSMTANAGDVIGKADLEGQFGTVSSWDMSNTITEIDGDAQYQVVWDTAEATNTADNFFVTVVIAPEGVDNFTTDTFENLSVTLDEVYIDGVLLEGYDASAAVNTAYYEGNKPGTTRIYLRGDWAQNTTKIIADNTDIQSQIKVVFTVSGTGAEGTSNVTETVAPTTEAETTEGETTEAATTEAATTEAAATTAAAATTTAAASTTAAATTAAATTAKAVATTAAAKSETAAATGDAGVGVAMVAIGAAAACAFVAKKRD